MDTSKMDIASKDENAKTISVFVRITPAMNAQLLKLAKKVGGGAGVSTMMRDIVEAALAEGINITKGKDGKVDAGR